MHWRPPRPMEKYNYPTDYCLLKHESTENPVLLVVAGMEDTSTGKNIHAPHNLPFIRTQ